MIQILTDYSLAEESPDHLFPEGTKNDNNTNPLFIEKTHQYLSRYHHPYPNTFCFMDLGCSGGQLVADFKAKGYTAVGLEGSDYSLKNQRANWATLANTNLFTCDITKPFYVMADDQVTQFHIITAWDVLEHIKTDDLEGLFENIKSNLLPQGCFIATTSDESVPRNGLELHQTRWPEAFWKDYIKSNHPDLTPYDIGLQPQEYVRWNYSTGKGFLCYQLNKRVQI